jgi:hypothetical protein
MQLLTSWPQIASLLASLLFFLPHMQAAYTSDKLWTRSISELLASALLVEQYVFKN